MASSSIREKLAGSLPAGSTGQAGTTLLSFDVLETWNAQPVTQVNAGSGDPFSSVAQVLQSTLQDASDSVTRANKQLAELQGLQQQMLASTAQNTQALNANTSAKGGGSGALSAVGNVVTGMLGQASILTPIIGGLLSLFGGRETPAAPVFNVSALPAPVSVETKIGAPAPAPVSPVVQTPAVQTAPSQTASVQIQVNAMDSRSFLDHSSDIADAVRQALLHSHALSDVIAEL